MQKLTLSIVLTNAIFILCYFAAYFIVDWTGYDRASVLLMMTATAYSPLLCPVLRRRYHAAWLNRVKRTANTYLISLILVGIAAAIAALGLDVMPYLMALSLFSALTGVIDAFLNTSPDQNLTSNLPPLKRG